MSKPPNSCMVWWVVGSILHEVDPWSNFSFKPVLQDWCNKGHGMCYPVYGMVHIKELLMLIGKNSPCGGSRLPLSLFEWSFTICPLTYNRKYNVLSASLNKTFPSFLPKLLPVMKEVMLFGVGFVFVLGVLGVFLFVFFWGGVSFVLLLFFICLFCFVFCDFDIYGEVCLHKIFLSWPWWNKRYVQLLQNKYYYLIHNRTRIIFYYDGTRIISCS